MFNFKKDIDFSKVLLIILIILILSGAVVSLKIAFVRMNNWILPPKPIQLIKPYPSSSPSPSPSPSLSPGSAPLPPLPPLPNPESPDDSTDESTLQKINDFLGNLLKDLLTHPAFYEQISFQLLSGTIIEGVVYLAQVGIAETLRYAAIKALSFLESVILSLAERFGRESLKKFGIYLSETVIKNLVKRSSLFVAEEVGDKGALEAGELAATALIKSSAGLAVGEAASAFAGPIGLAFDILQAGGMLLDIWDPAKYANMQENSKINEIRLSAIDSLMQALSGLKVPLQLRPSKGPLYELYKKASETDPDSKDPKSPSNIIHDCYEHAILNIMNSPSFVDSAMDALHNDGKFLTDKESMTRFMIRNLNPEIVLKYCNEMQCQENDGVSVRLTGECTFKNYDTCLKSNIPKGKCTFDYDTCLTTDISYQENPAEGEVYVEWDKERKECSMALTVVKDMCKQKNVGTDNHPDDGKIGIDYDPRTGLCNITPYYCQNRYGQNITHENGYPDCHVTGFQSFWENIFGKTIVRAFTRTYDNAVG